MLFLGLKSFQKLTSWQRLIADPYENGNDKPLLSILKRIMWRQSKLHVIDELNIPKRHEYYIELKFSPVEYEYYKRLHSEFKTQLKLQNESYKNNHNNLIFSDRSYASQRRTIRRNLASLTVGEQFDILRKACCHPQISRQSLMGDNHNKNKEFLTMNAIMQKMIDEATDKMTADERQLCAA